MERVLIHESALAEEIFIVFVVSVPKTDVFGTVGRFYLRDMPIDIHNRIVVQLTYANCTK